MEYALIFTILACVVGFWMAWGVGANDLANIVSPAIGSRAITVPQAVLIAVFFEIAGAFLGGSEVTNTIRSGIINIAVLQNTPQLFIYGMLSVLLAGAVWINTASYLGMPVSITNTIVGALVGVGAIMLGFNAIHWKEVSYIVASWIGSPIIAGAIAFLLFISIRQSILGAEEPFQAAKRIIPLYLFLVGIVLSIMMTLKTFQHFHLALNIWQSTLAISITTLMVLIIGIYAMRHLQAKTHLKRHVQFVYIEGMFSVLMAFTACAMVFAHGSNDVAITIGPAIGVVEQLWGGQPLHKHTLIVSGMTLLGCLSVILGLFMHGRKVIETVGTSITLLTPSRAFAATLAASSTVVVSTSTGIPVSATQTLVGAVFGVGLARGIDALNLNVIRNIFMSWIVTIPVAAFLATLFFVVLQRVFG
jgi:inorganic phosphate transporter, PiT family